MNDQTCDEIARYVFLYRNPWYPHKSAQPSMTRQLLPTTRRALFIWTHTCGVYRFHNCRSKRLRPAHSESWLLRHRSLSCAMTPSPHDTKSTDSDAPRATHWHSTPRHLLSRHTRALVGSRLDDCESSPSPLAFAAHARARRLAHARLRVEPLATCFR